MIKYYFDKFLSPKNLLIIASIFLLLIFHEFILDKIDSLIVTKFLDTIRSSLIIDVSVLLCVSLTFILLFRQFKSGKAHHKLLVIVFACFALIHIYFRLSNSRYIFENFYCCNYIAYLDTSILFLIFTLGLCFFENTKIVEPVYKEMPFAIDVPIQESKNDLLNRAKFAKKIADKIQSKSVMNGGSLAIGITGEWGSGKTSFCNMIKGNIETSGRIIIQFNPWRSNTAEKIIEDFFELLISELQRYDRELSKNIYDYASQLADLDENIGTKALKLISNPIIEKNKNELYERVNKSIGEIKKQIVVFIDDLDRLSKSEVIEVLRIIRNTANFNNVIYIVCYDKEYVVGALRYYNDSKYSTYLEKIFQFEFVLPLFDAKILRDYLIDILCRELGDSHRNELESIINNSTSGVIFTDKVIKTHRDAIRLANSYLFEITEIQSEVNWYDFYLLQLLKLKFPTFYTFLIQNYEQFFIAIDSTLGYIRLRKTNETVSDNFKNIFDGHYLNRDQEEDEAPEVNSSVLKSYLLQERNKERITSEQIFLIESIINELIDVERQINKQYRNQSKKYFSKVDNTFRYFGFDISENEIPYMEFEEYRRKPFQDYAKKIDEWNNEQKFQSLWDYIIKVEDFSTKLEFENHVKAIKKIGLIMYENNRSSSFDLQYLIKVLQHVFSKKLDSAALYPNKNEYQIFLRSILDSNTVPAIFESDLVKTILNKEYEFPLPDEELSEKSLSFLSDYMALSLPVDKNFWTLYHNARERLAGEYYSRKHSKALPLIIEYWKHHVDACALSSIIRHSAPESKHFYFAHKDWIDFFPTITEFETWFAGAAHLNKNSDCYKEFSSFLEKTKAVAYQPIEFEFSHLKPSMWS